MEQRGTQEHERRVEAVYDGGPVVVISVVVQSRALKYHYICSHNTEKESNTMAHAIEYFLENIVSIGIHQDSSGILAALAL